MSGALDAAPNYEVSLVATVVSIFHLSPLPLTCDYLWPAPGTDRCLSASDAAQSDKQVTGRPRINSRRVSAIFSAHSARAAQSVAGATKPSVSCAGCVGSPG